MGVTVETRRPQVLPPLERDWLVRLGLTIAVGLDLIGLLVTRGAPDLPIDGPGPIVGAALVLALANYAFRNVAFRLMDLSYTLPVVGRIARLSHDFSEAHEPPGWLNAEVELCRSYVRFVSSLSEEEFENCRLYLGKAGDIGRRPMPVWMIASIALLALAGALTFAYALDPFLIVDLASRGWVVVGTAWVLLLVLAWLANTAGREYRRARTLRRAASHSARVELLGPIPLVTDQSFDDGASVSAQLVNRLAKSPSDRGSYLWLAVAALAFASAVVAYGFVGTAVPALTTARPSLAIGTGAVLLMGVVVLASGLRYGFAGLESHEAFRAIRGAASFAEYWEPTLRRIQTAELRLHMLHRNMESRSPREIDFQRDFVDFMIEERARGASNLHLPRGYRTTTAPRQAS